MHLGRTIGIQDIRSSSAIVEAFRADMDLVVPDRELPELHDPDVAHVLLDWSGVSFDDSNPSIAGFDSAIGGIQKDNLKMRTPHRGFPILARDGLAVSDS